MLLVDATLWDGHTRREDMDVHWEGDRIVAIGTDLPREGRDVLDGTGTTVIPGLIDSHVHLSMVPGAAWRTGDPQEELLLHHARAYLASGVTTILDPGVADPPVFPVGPRYLHTGTPFSPPGGYVTAIIPSLTPVATPEEVTRRLDSMGDAVGVKVTVERGFRGPLWPLHTPEMADAIRAGAEARGLPMFVHAMSPREQSWAMDHLDPDVFVHPLDRPDRKVIRRVLDAGIAEMTTLSVLDALLTGWEPSRLDDVPFVPPRELETARDRDTVRAFQHEFARTVVPGTGPLGASSIARGMIRSQLRRTNRSIRAMRDAGVPLLMGSDSGNWPIIPFLFHGPTSIREIELIGLAGLTPEEALVTATVNPARVLGLDSGVIEVGRRADLVVVEGDPLTDLSALRTLRWVIHDGVAKTPRGWMDL